MKNPDSFIIGRNDKKRIEVRPILATKLIVNNPRRELFFNLKPINLSKTHPGKKNATNIVRIKFNVWSGVPITFEINTKLAQEIKK